MPALSMVQKKKRLAWCKTRLHWTESDWKNVIFSDESKLELHPRRRQHVRRPIGSRYDERYTLGTRKFSPSIMAWGAIRSDGVTSMIKCVDSIDSLKYQRILDLGLPTILEEGKIFQQDGATCHTSRSTKECMRQMRVHVLPDWPPQSPDLSLIENIWYFWKEKVAAR